STRYAGQAGGWLSQVLDEDLGSRALPMFEAALAMTTESSFSVLGSVLAAALERANPVELASTLDARMPEHTVSLAETAVWALRVLLDANPPASERARLLNNLGKRFSDLGRRDEALATANEAVDTCRALAAARPEAFLPDLAGSLNNLGNM